MGEAVGGIDFRQAFKRLSGPLPWPRGGAWRMASVTKCLAPRTASMGVSPRTRRLSRGEEKAQPVPWVEVEGRCSPRYLWISPEGRRRMSVGWAWSPAVATMWRCGWRWARVWVAASASGRVWTGWAVRAESSDQLGVIQVT